jgi:hypothetical protein
MGLSCCPNSGKVSVEADVIVAEAGNNQPSDGTQVVSTSFASLQ